ncbi:MAG: NAD(P)H-hydrate dehydratase [Clostridiales bacterium]|jgi:NAD(P)H-hydrate epimerase|nr:NAD(P)H-hydrate dehydratase [Clostridiales bacterium]
MADTQIVTGKMLKGLFAERGRDTHKKDYGKLAVIGGCKYYVGAPLIAECGAAALRTGAGLNVLAVPDFLCQAVYGRVTESTVFPLKSADGFISFDASEFDILTKDITAACFGMGLGKCPDAGIITEYLTVSGIPVLLDADALNFLADNKQYLRAFKNRKILVTPHAGEMARLCGVEISGVLKNPVDTAKDFAKEYGIIVLLKGADTVVTDGEKIFLNTAGDPCMAKGGSGDLLAGIIGGLLAQGREPLISAAAGAFIAGSAALKAKESFTQYGVLPTDTARFVPEVLKEIISL